MSNYAAAQGIGWKSRRDKQITNEQILEGVDKPTHTDLLRLERLRLLGRVLAHGPAHLRRLFAQGWREGYGWAQQVRIDLNWARSYTDPDERGGAADLDEWLQWCKGDRRSFNAHIKKIAARARMKVFDEEHLRRWQKRLQEWTHTEELPAFPTQVITGSKTYVCYDCGYSDRNISHVRRHITRAHLAEQHPVSWATGTLCFACGRDYGSYNRLSIIC